MSKEINDRVREVRQILNLSQIDFSKRIGIKQGTLSDIERKRINVSPKTIARLSENLGISTVWLYTGNDDIFIDENYNKLYSKSVRDDVRNIEKSDKSIRVTDYRKKPEPIIGINENLEAVFETKSTYTPNIVHGFDENFPLYLDLHVTKRLYSEIFQQKDDLSQLFGSMNELSSFMHIIENIDYHYFNKVNSIITNRYKYYNGKSFDFDRYKSDVIDELKKLMKFKPALDKIAEAINVFYKEIKNLDEHDIVNGFFGHDKV